MDPNIASSLTDHIPTSVDQVIDADRNSVIQQYLKVGTAKYVVVRSMSQHFRERKTQKEWSGLSNEGSIALRMSEIAIALKNSPFMVYKTDETTTHGAARYWLDDNTGPSNIKPYGRPPNTSDGPSSSKKQKTIKTINDSDGEDKDFKPNKKWAVDALAYVNDYVSAVQNRNKELLELRNEATKRVQEKDATISDLNKVIVRKDETINELEKQVKLLEEAKKQVGVSGFVQHLKEFVTNCEIIMSSPDGTQPQSV